MDEEKLKKFVFYIERNMQVKLSSKKDNFYYFQYVGCDDLNGAGAYIAGAKHFAEIPYKDLQVLVEYPPIYGKRRFIFHGHPKVASMLQRTYGGIVLLKHYWCLDNIRGDNSPFGYNTKAYNVNMISAKVIEEQIRHCLPY